MGGASLAAFVLIELFKSHLKAKKEMFAVITMLDLMEKENLRKENLARFLNRFPQFKDRLGHVCYWTPKITNADDLIQSSQRASKALLSVFRDEHFQSLTESGAVDPFTREVIQRLDHEEKLISEMRTDLDELNRRLKKAA